MGKRFGTIDQGPIFVEPDTTFHLIKNFRPTEQGGYISISGPLPLIAKPTTGGPPDSGSANPSTPAYGDVRGIFHSTVRNGDRELILLHVDNEIWELEGWDRHYQVLVGPSVADGGSATPELEANIVEPTPTDFPTQWVSVPNGVVIIPSGSRAFFYDGDCVLLLGYDAPPAAPTGLGPESSSTTWFPDPDSPMSGVNDIGYAMDGLVRAYDRTGGTINVHPSSAMHPIFRLGRLGTVDTPGNISVLAQSGEEDNDAQVMGYLLPGRYRAKVQHVDRWGNLSPLSAPSNDIVFQRQPSMAPNFPSTPNPWNMRWINADCARKQVAWSGIKPGPQGTIGRILYRTKDLENSGTTAYFEIPRDALTTEGAFATIPDNMVTDFPDNIPDSWLVNQPVEVQPFPRARLAATAFGRLWVANAEGDEGALWWSMPGRWGTIETVAKMYPSPDGSAITGLHAVKGGLLVFSANGTYLVSDNDRGDGFRSDVISSRIGCVAPSSIVTMRNGIVVWLGTDGFYAWDGTQVSYLWLNQALWAKRINRSRMHRAVACFDSRHGEYRCWMAYDGQQNNKTCFVYDGAAWRQRDDVSAAGVATTQDHRRLCLVAGTYDGDDGAWVLDAAGDQIDGTMRTGWIRSTRSQEPSSMRRVYLWLRETTYVASDDDSIMVSVRSDYRSDVVDSQPVKPFLDLKSGYGVAPAYWSVTKWGATDAKWRIRRPFWAVADVEIGSAEVFQVEVTSTRKIEIMGFVFEEAPRESSGGQLGR
jgi:hypothetical protein